MLVLALALALLDGAVGALVWLKTYAPLAPGRVYGANPADGHVVEPADGSGGTPVVYLRDDGSFRGCRLRSRPRASADPA